MKRSRWDFLRCHLLKGRKGSLSVHPTVVELKAQRIPERDAQNKNKIDDVIKIEEQRNPAINKDHHTVKSIQPPLLACYASQFRGTPRFILWHKNSQNKQNADPSTRSDHGFHDYCSEQLDQLSTMANVGSDSNAESLLGEGRSPNSHNHQFNKWGLMGSSIIQRMASIVPSIPSSARKKKKKGKKEKKALFTIYQGLGDIIFEIIAPANTSKEAWEMLQKAFGGVDENNLWILFKFMNKGLQKEEKTKLWSKHYKPSLLLKIEVNQNFKKEEVMDKEEEEAEIRPIRNLQTMKVMEKILAKEAEVIVEDVIKAVDVAKILKGLKYNAIFAKEYDLLTFEEACNEEKWRQAMNEEIRAINKNDTWELTTLPEDH
ncbi:hypothetical protein MUK42_15826 [Musa troglodytarum]|uniref:Uncharacterized protein n=1 Tax=Musa troglodytarum TaxID=320322 RepID=A0A9E7EYE3_9LILI|nr:hypothetical protein MUK42_15826 [Musa troglodytarum]